jgi:hypothetical protein
MTALGAQVLRREPPPLDGAGVLSDPIQPSFWQAHKAQPKHGQADHVLTVLSTPRVRVASTHGTANVRRPLGISLEAA